MGPIDRIEAVFEIKNLIYDYARFLDLNRPEDQAVTFAPDGVADYAGTDVKGAEAIMAAVKPALQAWVASCHTITNVQVQMLTETTARSVCYLYAWRRVDPSGEGDYEVRGQYHDELVRLDDGWRFARRTFLTMAATPPRPDVPHIDRRPSAAS